MNRFLDNNTLQFIRHEIKEKLLLIQLLLEDCETNREKIIEEIGKINLILTSDRENEIELDIIKYCREFKESSIADIVLEYREKELVIFTKDSFYTIFNNLASNMIKYSIEFRKIEVLNYKDTIKIKFINDGETIIRNADQLFNKGFRGENASKIAGEGLGLYFSKLSSESLGMKLEYINDGMNNFILSIQQ